MARPDPLTPAVQAAFLGALRGGAGVVAAAASVGVLPGTLYRRRKRDALFDAAWTFAAEASSPWHWDESTGRKARTAGAKRRLRFGARRRAAFLALLELSCNTDSAAAGAGVNRSTVRRHLRRDPAFKRDSVEALRRGYARLERDVEAEWAAARARLRSGGLRREIEPKGEISDDFDTQMRLLDRWSRKDGSLGPREVRFGRQRRWSFERAIDLLYRKMRWMGLIEDEG